MARKLPRMIVLSELDRFIYYIKFQKNGCWNWQGTTQRGYGCFSLNGKSYRSHRYSYEKHNGRKVSSGYHLHHKCHNRLCVNPLHIIEVTPRQHMALHPNWVASKKLAQTHCIHGHLLDKDNTYIRKDGRRNCLKCKDRRDRERRLRVKLRG